MKTVLLFILITMVVYPQTYRLTGKVIDAKTGEALPYTNIREPGGKGTATNQEGKFTLQLPDGKFTLTASFIGYISDTLKVEIPRDADNEIVFKLRPRDVELPEVTVFPGENPSLEIIRRAIERKEQLKKDLLSYQMNAYTKTVIKTTSDVSGRQGGITVSAGAADSAGLKIGAIFENQSTGYFSAPDNFKEIILARKQTANLPSFVNTLTGGRFIQNFYSDDLNFLGKPLMAPLAQDALGYYYFYISDTLTINTTPVFEITMTPDDDADPGFRGKIYIADGTFSLLKVDLELNRAANTGGIFDSMRIYQQFEEYQNFPMPADYRIFARVNFMGLIRIGFEVATVLSEYIVNNPIPAEIFSGAVVTVVPEADKRDSLYWGELQTIPGTSEEDSAYVLFDSLKNAPQTFWEQYSYIGTSSTVYEHFTIPGLLGIYHYNRVEGHSFDADFGVRGLLDNRLRGSVGFSYGLGDKKMKEKIKLEYWSGTYREVRFALTLVNGTEYLFPDAAYKSHFQTTILSLFTKFEADDYFYRKGAEFEIYADVFQSVVLNAGYSYTDDKSAYQTTNYSFFSRGKSFRVNLPVTEVSFHSVSGGIGFDFRDYIEDGYYKRRIGRRNFLPQINLNVKYSSGGTLNKSFMSYNIKLRGSVAVSLNTDLSYRLNGFYSNGGVPFQFLTPAAGNINWDARENTFRTLNIYSAAGDRGYTAFLNYDMGDVLFRMSGIPFINKAELQLGTFLNSGLFVQNPESKLLKNTLDVGELIKPFYEAGFSIGHVVVPIQFEFAWKLNYRGKENFRISIVSLLNL